MIQLIFDKNLESPDFIEIFKSEDSYQPALDAKLVATQKIVLRPRVRRAISRSGRDSSK
jgi:predicted component of type VI protein secretion system